MNPTEKQVLDYILENPGQKTRKIAEVLSIPHGTVSTAVAQLRKYGDLKPAVVDVESPTYAQCWPVDKDFPAPTLTGGSVDTGSAGGLGGESCTPSGLAPDSPTATLSEIEQLRKELEAERIKTAFAQKEQSQAVTTANVISADLQSVRRLLKSQRQRANKAEDLLADIDWLCNAAGLTTRGDTADLLCLLLERIGAEWLSEGLRERRRLFAEIAEKEAAIRGLDAVIRARMEQGPETDNKCKCGREATKVEGDQGFTQCDPCYRKGEE